MKQEIEKNLKDLGLSPNEVKVYVALTKLGESPASKVAKKADIPRTTAISILEKLQKENLISSHSYRGTAYYWIESPFIFKESLFTKIRLAEDLGALLGGLYREEAHFPTAKIYDTKSGIRKSIEKMLASLDKKDIIYTIDTPNEGNYLKIYGENIENIILNQKKKKSIQTVTLVPNGSYKEINPRKIKNQSIAIRELPPGINFKGSLWIVKNTVFHFSGNPPFLVALNHKNIAEGIKSIFDFLWDLSTPA